MENEHKTTVEEEVSPTGKNPGDSSFWNEGGLDHETTKQMANWEEQRRYKDRIEHLGKEELARLREKGEQSTDELTPEQTKRLIFALGDQVIHQMAVEEDRKIEQEKRWQRQEAQRKEEIARCRKEYEDKRPINRVKRFFRIMVGLEKE